MELTRIGIAERAHANLHGQISLVKECIDWAIHRCGILACTGHKPFAVRPVGVAIRRFLIPGDRQADT